MLKIRQQVIDLLIMHAKKDAPIEACGYLAEKNDTIEEHLPLTNIDASQQHFSLDPKEQFSAVRTIRSQGMKLRAVYHSHPASPARPSAEDIKLAFDPNISYVIVSLDKGAVIKSFRIVQGIVEEEPIEMRNDTEIPASALTYRIPESLPAEISDLESLITAFQGGGISETELKARRVPFGVYEQRKKGAYMVRVRCAAGIITPRQLQRVAQLSLQYASGMLHITTRQEIQIHDVALSNLVPIIRELSVEGLSTRGGGGNTVRNITAPWDSGITTEEIFDVAPYAVALTSAMTARGDSWLLPRKYKIAFSNSINDRAFATINDLGLIAQIQNGVRGFKVFVAGGMGRLSQPGNLLHEFVPASEIFKIAEAIKRVFSKYGNRKNKHAARLRFLWNTLGRTRFIALYEEEKARLTLEGIGGLDIVEFHEGVSEALAIGAETDASPEFEQWKQNYVHSQKQAGATSVCIPVLFGIITAEKAKVLADFLRVFGENTIRFTHDQNISLRNIPQEYLANVFHVAQKISELSRYPKVFGNAVACAGASTCQLGICRSRGALEAVVERLKISGVDLASLADLRLHVSGCSNTCGQHVIADLGFFGKVGRKDQHSFPEYTIVAGATVDAEGNRHLASKIDEINARDLPVFTQEFLRHYVDRKEKYSSFSSYMLAEGSGEIKRLCDKFRGIPSFDEDQSYYRDWGDTEPFSLAGKGTGECSAGLFDLIEIDLARVRLLRSTLSEVTSEALLGKTLFDISLASSRMLLITRGVEGATDADVFNLFIRLFLSEGLIDKKYLPVVEKAASGKIDDLVSFREEVCAFADAIETLYAGMDNSLQFKQQEFAVTAIAPQSESEKPDAVKDFTGVACPMNFVKTKMALAGLKSGQVLEIWLDDGAPIDNVPKSVAEEGHIIVSTKKTDNYWRVFIKKQ